MIKPVAQSDSGEFVARASLRVGGAGQFQRHGDVLQRGHGRDQMKGLEYDADMAAAEAGQGILVEFAEVLRRRLSTVPESACSRPAITINKRRFSRAGRADEANCLAISYMQIDIFEDMNAGRALPER